MSARREAAGGGPAASSLVSSAQPTLLCLGSHLAPSPCPASLHPAISVPCLCVGASPGCGRMSRGPLASSCPAAPTTTCPSLCPVRVATWDGRQSQDNQDKRAGWPGARRTSVSRLHCAAGRRACERWQREIAAGASVPLLFLVVPEPGWTDRQTDRYAGQRPDSATVSPCGSMPSAQSPT